MKRYGKRILTVLAGILMASAVNVNAKMMSVKELGKAAEEYEKDAGFIFVVGKFAYTSNYEGFNIQDVMLASRSIKGEEVTPDNVEDLVNTMTIYRIDREYNDNYQATGWNYGGTEVGNGTAFGDENAKVDIKYIDYHYLGAQEIEENISKAVEDLNKVSEEEDGFSSITYGNHIVTFNISDPSRMLVNYREQVMDLIKAFITDNGAKEVVYKGQTTKLEGDEQALEGIINSLAAQVLKDMAGVGQPTAGSTLNYASVANKEAKATVNYVDEDGNALSVEYTLQFKYDFKEEKNEVLSDVANSLDKVVKNDTKYGFKGITYENETLTFDIFDTTASLVTFAESDIINLFKANYAGAMSVTYHMEGKASKTIKIDNKTLEDSDVKAMAAQVLYYMSTDASELKDPSKEEADALTLGSVANKTVYATVTYADDTTVDYTLKFTYEVEGAKDYFLSEYSGTLAEEAKENNSFDDITYDPSTNTVTFVNAGYDYKLSDFADTSIVQLFKEWVEGASEVTYTVTTANNKTFTTNEAIKLNGGSQDVVTLAAQLLCRMAGKDEDSCKDAGNALESIAKELTTADIAGSSAVATFKFGETTVNYTLKFDYDVEKDMDEDFTKNAQQFSTAEKLGDFKSVEYDVDSKTLTYTFDDTHKTSKLTEWAGKADIIEMFNNLMKSGIVTSIEWTVDGNEPVKYTVAEDGKVQKEEAEVTASSIAGEILLAMAKNIAPETTNKQDLTYGSVAGQTATAKVTYKVGNMEEQTYEYHLSFVQETAAAE